MSVPSEIRFTKYVDITLTAYFMVKGVHRVGVGEALITPPPAPPQCVRRGAGDKQPHPGFVKERRK
jgi:hypothetical protein